mgnify:CR=1 FL=1
MPFDSCCTEEPLTTSWPTLLSSAHDLRRRLHRRPELAWDEHRTATTIRDELDRLGIAWRACADTGTLADIEPTGAASVGRPAEEPTESGEARTPWTPVRVALRADIDGIAVPEHADNPDRSEHDGIMHACGHDGHTAALVAAAGWVHAQRDALPGPVRLLFQPAEEGGHGARAMIGDGALDGVDAVYGWHNWPAMAFGRAACPDGTVMSANGTFEIVVDGQGGHSSQPEMTRDPVLAAAAVTLDLQQIVARRLPPQTPAVVAVTAIDAPSGLTVTPDVARVSGSIRVSSTAARDQVFALIAEIATATATAYGVTATVVPTTRYDATVNHPEPAQRWRDVLTAHLGADWADTDVAVPLMASEDFGEYTARVPGAFAIIGGGGPGTDVSCHSPRYRFNNALVATVAAMFCDIVGLDPP